MEYFALIIPVIAAIVATFIFKNKFTWWERSLPLSASILVILICKFCVKSAITSDTEYWGSLIVKARYYEYWETWVTKTCSYTTTCCCDSEGENCQTETHYYDCSYCDRNSAYWKAYDDAGNSWNISKEYYNYLRSKWSAKDQFIELNRSITDYGFCGDDGDAYEINWNNEIVASEAAVTKHTYVNKVQASHSAFKLPYISKKKAKELQLYDYPGMHDYYKQIVVHGLQGLYSQERSIEIDNKFQYFNGYYGSKNKVKLFVLLFYDKPISIAFDQEAYWDGGNQNELVICIGIEPRSKDIQWVKPFSWTNRKRVLVDCRENIAELGKFDPHEVYKAIEASIGKEDVYKDFRKDFNYLTVDLPGWSIWLIWVLTIAVTAGVLYWCYANDYESIEISGSGSNDGMYRVKRKIKVSWHRVKNYLKRIRFINRKS